MFSFPSPTLFKNHHHSETRASRARLVVVVAPPRRASVANERTNFVSSDSVVVARVASSRPRRWGENTLYTPPV